MRKSLIFLVCLALLVVGCGGTTAATSPQSAASGIPPASGPALLGRLIGAFVAYYGQPDSHSEIHNGQYHFQKYSDSNVDFLIVITDTTDRSKTQTAEDITIQADDSQQWSTATANTMCDQFFPTDAVYQKQVVTSGGIDEIYFSASLATLFPTSSFVDARGKPVKAGLFDVHYLIDADAAVKSCAMSIGTKQA